MGRELVAEEPVFREIITACDELLRPLSGWSLLDELGRTEENCSPRPDRDRPAGVVCPSNRIGCPLEVMGRYTECRRWP